VTKLAIVSYPCLEDADGWVESVRKRHDPQASLLRAHFTLVFPVNADLAPVAAHAAHVVAAAPPIRIILRRVEAVRDAVRGSGGHVFLVPNEGRAEITALHDELYDGVLLPHLRRDVPFVPHITVAACATYEQCESLALELNAAPLLIYGVIDRIDVIEIAAGKVRCLLTIPFGGAKPAGREACVDGPGRPTTG